MLVGSQPRRVAVIGGTRIPFARAHGAYASVGNQEMLTAALKATVDRFNLKGQRLGDVVAGAVMKHSSQWNLAREALLDSGLSPETPGLDVQRACGTSLEAAIVIGNKIALGQIDAGIAGGVDTVSDPPIVFGRALPAADAAEFPRQELRRAHRAVLRAAAAALQAVLPRHRRAAHRAVDGPAHRADGAHLADSARRPGRARARKPPACEQGLGRRIHVGPGRALPRAHDRQQRARRHQPREAREAQALFRRGRHADRRQLDADDRRRGGGAARKRGMGARARPAGAGLAHLRERRRRSISSAAKGC